jgi:hypothetical protein
MPGAPRGRDEAARPSNPDRTPPSEAAHLAVFTQPAPNLHRLFTPEAVAAAMLSAHHAFWSHSSEEGSKMNMFKKKIRSAILASIGTSLTIAGGTAAATGVNCHRIHARGVTPDYQEPCQVNPDPAFFACYVGRTKGTFEADWEIYFSFFPIELTNPPFPLPSESGTTLFQTDFEVFKTRRGEIHGYANYLMDLRMFDSGGFSGTFWVTSGTGIYEDATGWIAEIGTDATIEKFLLVGKVCGPNIPRGINDEKRN